MQKIHFQSIKSFFIVLFLLSGNAAIFAQAESDSTKKLKSPLFHDLKTKISFGSAISSGNVNNWEVRSEGDVSNTDSIFEYSVFARWLYSKADSVVSNREYFGGVKFDYKPYQSFSPFVMFTLFKNQYKGIDLRFSSLAGLKWLIYRSDACNYSLSAAAVYETEKYIPDAVKTGNEILRASIRPKFSQKIGKHATIENITFYKVNVKDSKDYIIESNSKFTTQISENFSLDLSYDISFTNIPPQITSNQQIEKLDQTMTASLVINF